MHRQQVGDEKITARRDGDAAAVKAPGVRLFSITHLLLPVHYYPAYYHS